MANRAMAVAQLTQLRLAIPASGNSPGEIPLACFPRTKDMDTHKVAKRVSFVTVDQTSNEPVNLQTAEMEETPSVNEIVTGPRETSPVPPPGFRPFEWPEVRRMTNGEFQRDPGLKFVTSWSAKIPEEEMSTPPPLEALSPIPMVTSQDSMTTQVGTTDLEDITPIVLDQIRSVTPVAHCGRVQRASVGPPVAIATGGPLLAHRWANGG